MNQLSEKYIKIDSDINSSWLRQNRTSDIQIGKFAGILEDLNTELED